MAQDSEGRKFNRIPGYTKKVGGKTIKVKPHVRSNRSDSKGKKYYPFYPKAKLHCLLCEEQKYCLCSTFTQFIEGVNSPSF